MSLLDQIGAANVVRIKRAPLYVKDLTYDRIRQPFERPHDALGNRHRNPIARVYSMFVDFCKRIVKPFSRIEIVVRIKPE
jgi:hypothetical protein